MPETFWLRSLDGVWFNAAHMAEARLVADRDGAYIVRFSTAARRDGGDYPVFRGRKEEAEKRLNGLLARMNAGRLREQDQW